ncbi:MAG TPA: PEP/pyruvate-binding domain-containing protein [Anaerolineales bacterium]|nr:PEP/pyruvate-binding domain-containing protein [Anaerolineales bacterium]
MDIFILPLSDERATLESVGGKGLSLAKLSRAGLPVPDGFHITTEAYRRFVDFNQLQPRLLAALQPVDSARPDSLDQASSAIGELFSAARIPEDLASAIRDACVQLAAGGQESRLEQPVAVRSSATAEDLPGASFAGQQESYLNLRGSQEVLAAVQKCWASLWTARAIAYRARQGIPPEAVALAVVVQQLVPAEASGVMFTANPINGRRQEIMITAAWGLGEAIVSGAVTPDTWIIDNGTAAVLRRETAQKLRMTVRTESGTRLARVPGKLKKKPVLSDARAAELARLGARIEQLYAMPMDIEWTLLDGTLAIVQARPITALPPVVAEEAGPPLEWPVPHPKAMLARGSFAEFVPEPVSPLFATLAVPIARDATLKLMSNIGVTDKDSYLFAVINDYVYVGFRFTPRMIWQFLKATLLLFPRMLKSAGAQAAAARERVLAARDKWQARALDALTPSELVQGAQDLFAATAEYYTVAQSGSIPTATMSEATFGGFYKALVKRAGDPEPARLLFGTENQALRAEKALYDLTMWARQETALASYLRTAPAAEIPAALRSDSRTVPGLDEFSRRFEAHLREFGQTLYDLDFAKPVPAENPEPLLQAVKIYLEGKQNPYERQQAAASFRERTVASISRRLDPLRRKYFLKVLKWALETAPLREDSIAEMGLAYPQLRRMLNELGRRLAQAGAIADPEDIYWLELHEVQAMAAQLERGAPLQNTAEEVERRKAKWHKMRRISPPPTLPKTGWLSRFYPSNEPLSMTLKGLGASAGKVTAPACVMLGPEDFGKMHDGDVIVAGITTPAWTPLFARAAGIVTDIGGPLSHSSIVAREYGIPAVLATGVGTRRIRDGQRITVDGGAGLVALRAA